MKLDLNLWTDGIIASEEGGQIDYLNVQEQERKEVVHQIQNDLILLARDLGQNQTQISTKLEDLFTTFGIEWFLYIFVGSEAITAAITADTTLAWLDVTAGAKTIREHLVTRLS